MLVSWRVVFKKGVDVVSVFQSSTLSSQPGSHDSSFWQASGESVGRSVRIKSETLMMVSGRCSLKLGGGFKYLLFSPFFGEDSHFD